MDCLQSTELKINRNTIGKAQMSISLKKQMYSKMKQKHKFSRERIDSFSCNFLENLLRLLFICLSHRTEK